MSSYLSDLRSKFFHFLIELADSISLLALFNVLAFDFLVNEDLLDAGAHSLRSKVTVQLKTIPTYSARMENKKQSHGILMVLITG